MGRLYADRDAFVKWEYQGEFGTSQASPSHSGRQGWYISAEKCEGLRQFFVIFAASRSSFLKSVRGY